MTWLLSFVSEIKVCHLARFAWLKFSYTLFTKIKYSVTRCNPDIKGSENANYVRELNKDCSKRSWHVTSVCGSVLTLCTGIFVRVCVLLEHLYYRPKPIHPRRAHVLNCHLHHTNGSVTSKYQCNSNASLIHAERTWQASFFSIPRSSTLLGHT